MPPVDILTSTAIIIATFVASKLILNDAAAIGVIIASVLYIQRLFDPIRNLMMQYTQIQRSMASGSRLFEFLDIQSAIKEQHGPASKANMLYKLVLDL